MTEYSNWSKKKERVKNLVLSWSISPSISFYASSFCTKINEENIVKMRTILKHKNVEQNVFLNDSTFLLLESPKKIMKNNLSSLLEAQRDIFEKKTKIFFFVLFFFSRNLSCGVDAFFASYSSSSSSLLSEPETILNRFPRRQSPFD